MVAFATTCAPKDAVSLPENRPPTRTVVRENDLYHYEIVSGPSIWLNRDPINENGARLLNDMNIPMNLWEELNRYSFVGNDPIGWIDRLGLDRMNPAIVDVHFDDPADPEKALERAKQIADAADVARQIGEEAAGDTRPGWFKRALGKVLGGAKNPRPDPASGMARLADPDAAAGLTIGAAKTACDNCIFENQLLDPIGDHRNGACKDICDTHQRLCRLRRHID